MGRILVLSRIWIRIDKFRRRLLVDLTLNCSRCIENIAKIVKSLKLIKKINGWRRHCCGSVTFLYGCGCGCGSSDPYLWLRNPYPEHWYIYVICYTKIKFMKSQNYRNQGFSYYFCLMIEGSGRPKNIRIRIRNSGGGIPALVQLPRYFLKLLLYHLPLLYPGPCIFKTHCFYW